MKARADEDNRDGVTRRVSGRFFCRGVGRRCLLSAERKMESRDREKPSG